MIEEMKQVLPLIDKVKTAKTDAQYEPFLNGLTQVQGFLNKVNTPEGRQQLFEVMNTSVNFCINHKLYPEKVLLDVEQFIKCILKYIVDNLSEEKMSQIFRTIMDPSRMIYETNAHSTECHSQFLTYQYSLNPLYKTFVDQLQVGTYVDCLRLCRSTGRQNWCRGVIEEIADENIKVRYLNEESSKTIYNIRSGHLMPYRSRSQALDRMYGLQEGQVILATQSDKWVLSTIKGRLETKNEQNEIIVTYLIAFRIYSDEGTTIEDTTQLKYIGYNRHHDEEINSNSPRLALCGEHICRRFATVEQFVDDSQDQLYQKDYEEQKFHAILRPKLSKSTILIRFMNYFGYLGGFEKILEVQSVDILANYMSALGNVSAQFSRQFCIEYVPKLQGLRHILLNSDEQTLRNMGREKMNLIIQAFKLLLDRILKEDERRDWIQSLSLEFVQLCFNCNFLDKRIMGLKLLTDMLQTANNNKCPESLLRWIEEQGVLELLFHHNTHLQLLERTKELIRTYFMIDNAFTPKHMALIWNLMQQNDNELRPIIFKLVNDVAVSMRDYHVHFFLEQIKLLRDDQILIEHVSLLYEMNRYQIKNQELVCLTIDLLWRLIEYAGAVSKQILEDKARQYICDLLRNLEIKEIKLQMIQRLISNIQNQIVESSSFKTMSHLINSFPKKTTSTYPKIAEEVVTTEYCQEDLVTELIERQGISTIIRMSIENLRVQFQGINGENVLEYSKYMNKLQERLLLVKAMISINGTAANIIDQQFLDLIWSGLIMKPICKIESELASSWLRELIEKDEQFSEKQLGVFFKRLLDSDSHLNENAFSCFQSILQYVNQKEYRMHRQQLQLNTTCDQYGNVMAMSNTGANESDSLDFDILVPVDQIIGIEYLWHIVFNSQLDKAVQLLVKLNLTQQEQFIEQILNKMNCNDQPTILRCLDVLSNLLNETEYKGIGSQLSLDGLVRGDSFNIVLLNELGDGSNQNRVTMKVYSRQTLFELRRQIAKEFNTVWEQIKLVRGGVVVQDTENGKTLKQLGLRKSETINIYRRKTKPIPQTPLVIDGKLTQQFIKVLQNLFEMYSTNGQMSKEQLSNFGVKAASDEGFKAEKRIREVFDKYDTNGDDYLSLDNFIQFYDDCCVQQKITQVVWRNLHAFGYKNDLTVISNDVTLDEEKLPRYQLAHNDRFYRLMFNFIQRSDEVAQECWKLLCYLPVFEAAKQRILNFEDFSKDQSYQLLYSIKIVEHLLQVDDYCTKFIMSGGFSTLQNILKTEDQNIKVTRQIQVSIIGIFTSHMAAALQPTFPNIYQVQQHVKQPLQANFDVIQQLLDGTYNATLDNKPQIRVKETDEFWDLMRRVMGQDLQINYINLLQYVISLQLDVSEDRLLIELVLITITTIVGYNLQNATECFIQQLEFIKQRYAQLLFAQKGLLVRKFSANSLFLIYRCQPYVGQPLIKMLIELFPSHDNKDSQLYFDLLAKLIQDVEYRNEQFAQNIIRQLKEYEPNETRVMMAADKTLCGLLSILESISIVDSNVLTPDLINYLYRVHLFCFHLYTFQLTPQKQNTPDYVKCKSAESRRIVYRIVVLYMRKNYQFEMLDLTNIIYSIGVYNQFEIKLNPKTYHGYVGIRNLGCICYMNAMMQQFFMTPEFRYSMLRADDGVEDKVVTYKDSTGYEWQVDDNAIHQFQRLLAYLELSERPDFNPAPFCFSFKDYDGQAVNVSLQQDAQEFLNQFFDRLDNQLKDKGWQQFLEGIYGGHTCSQMICNGCNNMREKFDLFYTLSVKVKGVKSIQESFESMIHGEVIKDYYCEACKTKNDLLKRQCLDTLPNVLIVHIQRIVFNLDMFMNEKLSSRLEFPHSLNLTPYTREGLANQPLKTPSDYKLKGVVVHKGTAQYGHYYSLINIKPEKWLKFNDSIIEDFDVRKLPMECFGGKESEDQQPSDFQQDQGSSTNAYILVYERVNKQNIELKFSTLEQRTEIMQKFPESIIEETNNQTLDYSSMTQQYIPEKLFKEIWYDNHRFMMERHIYSDEFFRFVKDVAEAYRYPLDYTPITNPEQLPPYFGIYGGYNDLENPELVQNLLHNVTYLVTELVSRSADHSTIKAFTLVIMNLINLIPTRALYIFKTLIVDKQQKVLNVLLCAPDFSIRQAIQQILLHFVNVIVYIHALTLDTEFLQILQTDDQTIIVEQTVIRFLIDLLAKMHNEVAKNPTKFNYYFTFWRDFVKSGQIQVQFASQVQLVSILADFFMEKQSPQGLQKNPYYEFLQDKKITMASKMVVPFFSPLFQCIHALISDRTYILSPNDQLCLSSLVFYKRGLVECQDFESVKSIVLRMIYDDIQLSRNVIEILLEEIGKANYENVGQFLGLAYHILNIYDQHQQLRIEWLLGFPEPLYQDKFVTGSPLNLGQAGINYVSHIGVEVTSILNGLFENQKRFQNIAIQMIKMLLACADTNKQVFSYLVNVTPPCYLYSKYTDWFEKFLLDFQEDCLKYPVIANSVFFNKQKELEETQQYWQNFKKHYAQITEVGLFDPIQPIYILGQTQSAELISSVVQTDGVILDCYESTLYFIESKPVLTTNLVFPQWVLYDNIYVQLVKVDNASNIHNLMLKPITSNIPKPPPLPKRKDVVDGIDFAPASAPATEIGCQEQQKVNEDFMKEMSNFSIELEQFPDVGGTTTTNNKPEVQMKEECNLDLQIAPILRRFMIRNTTNQQINITYSITLDPEFMVNFKHPTKVCKSVPPNTTAYLTTIMKTIPSMDWGLYVETMDINFNDAGTQPTQVKKQVRIDEEVQVFMPNIVNDSQIPCPACTYMQSSSNHFCEICTTEFNDQIKSLGFSLCYKRCLKNKDALQTSHIHHTLYPCMEHCALKYKKVVDIVLDQ